MIFMSRHIFFIATLGVMVLGLMGCQATMDNKLEGRLDYDQLYEQLSKENDKFLQVRENEKKLEQVQKNVEDIISPVIPVYNPLEDATISISVQEESIHNILYVVARNAGMNLVIEPGIDLENRVTISFENASSSLVVEKLLEAYDLAYEVTDNIIAVKRFSEKIFSLDFVNALTELESNSGGDIFGSALSGSGQLAGSFTMKSSTSEEALDENSLYGKILLSVEAIISETSTSANEDGSSSQGDERNLGGNLGSKGFYSLDPLTGALYVRTSPAKMRTIAQMLNKLRLKLAKQVVIDARIMEVRLDDSFSFGIDFAWVASRLSWGDGANTALNILQRGAGDITARTFADNGTIATLTGFESGDVAFDAAIEAMQTFGGVTVVANPHVRAKHGQPALFQSGRSFQYVSNVARELDENGNISYAVTTANVFDGIMLGVMPFITDDNKVDLQIFPIKSEVDRGSMDLVEVTSGGDRITLPQVDVKNVSTTVRVGDGDTIILGGLIDKAQGETDTGVPVLSDIPILGWLFKTRKSTDAVRELVIVMTVKVVH